MNKVKGCFITIIVVFILIVLVFLFTSFLNPGNKDILILGIDEREDSNTFVGLTDTIIIFHIGGPGKKSSLISIPRDTRVNLEGYGWNKINAAYKFGGHDMIKEEVYQLTGINANKVMVVNFRGFKEIINILGGVTITVEEPLHDPLSGADFDPGTYTMNGDQALSFVRCRSTARADFDRVDRQKYFLSELLKQKFNLSIIPKAPQIIEVLNEETESNFSVWDFCSTGFMILFSSKDINWLTIPGTPASIDGISYVVVDENEVRNYLNENLK
ncbi:MAG: LCP family protein [Actinomycetota bacterium]|nr:LCP family protein [Actinomycetota bacterium]